MYFNKLNKNDKRMIAAYVRVSSKDQAKGHSIESQINIAKRISQMVFGQEIDHVFKDVAKSGFHNVYRADYEEMVKLVKKNKIKAIIIWRSDRLIRNFIKDEKLYQLFQKQKVQILSATEHIDFSTASGRKEQRNRGVENQFSSELTSERVIATNTNSALLGNFPKGNVPLGYRRIHDLFPGAPIELDPIIAPQVLHIFELVANRKMSLLQANTYLNSINYMQRKWNIPFLRRLLTNPIYKGTYVNNLQNPTLIIPNHSPALVSEKMFEKVQDIIHGRCHENKYNYIFKSFIYCKHCNAIMKPDCTRKPNGSIYLYYVCSHCKTRINQNKVMSNVLFEFNQIIFQKNSDEYTKSLLSKKEKLLKQVELLEKWFYQEELLDYDTYDKKTKAALIEIKKLNNDFNTHYSDNKKYFNNLPFHEKRKWLIEHIDKIEYNYKKKNYKIFYLNALEQKNKL